MFDKDWRKRAGPLAIFAVLVLALGAVIWILATQTSGVKVAREAPDMVALLPPPPPPPPPPKDQPPPPPDKIVETEPKPVDQPKAPTPDTPAPLTQNAPAQAGGDSFGLQAGSGGGMKIGGTGTGQTAGVAGGFNEAAYGRRMGVDIQRAIQGAEKDNRLVFTVDVAVFVDAAGRVTRASILKGSGDAQLDDALLAVLRGARMSEPPPAGLKFPQRVTIRGRRGA